MWAGGVSDDRHVAAHPGRTDRQDRHTDEAETAASHNGEEIGPLGTAEEPEGDQHQECRFHVEDDPRRVVASALDRRQRQRGCRRWRLGLSHRGQFCTIGPVTTLDSVIGHGPVLQRLVASGLDDELTHALLLIGPEGVGKTTAALALASELLDARDWPGGLAAHPDLWVEDSASENVGIDRMRPSPKRRAGEDDAGPSLQQFLSLTPYAGGRRVAVIARADRLTEQAADNVLKTLEEPPPRTHLLLTSAHPEQLPQTIRSRCETVVLGPVVSGVIEDWLRRVHGISERDAATAAALAAGRPGRALRLASEAGALETELDALDRFIGAGGGGVAGALRAAGAVTVAASAGTERSAEVREQALITLGAWASFVRDAACFAAGAPELALWKAYRPALERWAEDLDLTRIVEILARILETSEAVAMYAQPRLAFEALLLDIFAGANSPPVVTVVPRAGLEVSAGGGARGKSRRSPAARRG
jgi:DNA polymerase III subunit delta'